MHPSEPSRVARRWRAQAQLNHHWSWWSSGSETGPVQTKSSQSPLRIRSVRWLKGAPPGTWPKQLQAKKCFSFPKKRSSNLCSLAKARVRPASVLSSREGKILAQWKSSAMKKWRPTKFQWRSKTRHARRRQTSVVRDLENEAQSDSYFFLGNWNPERHTSSQYSSSHSASLEVSFLNCSYHACWDSRKPLYASVLS